MQYSERERVERVVKRREHITLVEHNSRGEIIGENSYGWVEKEEVEG